MASIKWSGLVSEVKGVLNGSILSYSLHGQTIRNRRSAIGRTSAAWSASRARLQYIAGVWRTLTAGQQAGWNAAGVSFPYTDKFGNSQTPSGFQLMCTLNLNLFFTGRPTLTAAPSPVSQEDITSCELVQDTPPDLIMTFGRAAAGNQYVVVYCSRVLPLGITSPPRSLRYVAKQLSNVGTDYDITAAYEAIFGALPSSGRIFYKVLLISKTTGQSWHYADNYLDLH